MDVECPLLTDCLTLGKTRLPWLILREFYQEINRLYGEKVRKQIQISGFHLRTHFSLFDGVGRVGLLWFFLKKTKFDYFFLPISMNALWQRIPGDQGLTCSPGSFSTPRFFQSQPMTDISPAASLPWRCWAGSPRWKSFTSSGKIPFQKSFTAGCNQLISGAFPGTAHSSKLSFQLQQPKGKERQKSGIFFPGKIRTCLWHWEICLSFHRNPETVVLPRGVKALSLHNYSWIISDP